jgi:hypothetical protein
MRKFIQIVFFGLIGLAAFGHIIGANDRPVHAQSIEFKCHGHSERGKWTLNLDSWTDADFRKVRDLHVELRAIDPTMKDQDADIASMVDQLVCAGSTFERVSDNLKRMSRSVVALRAAVRP